MPAQRVNQNPYDFGVDIAMVFNNGQGDIDPLLNVVTGPRVVAQSLYIACMATAGTIIGAPDVGAGIKNALNNPSSPTLLQRAIVRTALSDARVKSATCSVQENGNEYKFFLTALLVDGSRVEVSNNGITA